MAIDSSCKHPQGNIFVCPERTFTILNDGTIPNQDTPVDYWTEQGTCSCCGKERIHGEEKEKEAKAH